MHHESDHELLGAFARVRPWRGVETGCGVSAAPLSAPGFPSPGASRRAPDSPPTTSAADSEVTWHEVAPPHPGRALLQNRSPASLLVNVGTLLVGGMSARVVCRSTVVAGRSAAIVAVEPVGARWWSAGDLRCAGHADPLVTALLLQAQLAAPGFACAARTAAWSLASTCQLRQPSLELVPVGWALTDADGLAAAWVLEREAPYATARAAITQPDAGGDMGLMDALHAGLHTGVLVAYEATRAVWGRDVVILPAGRRLADRVLARVMDAA